jgi:hypothetical protein
MSSGYLTRVLKIVFQDLRCGRNKNDLQIYQHEVIQLKVVKINGFKNGHY